MNGWKDQGGAPDFLLRRRQPGAKDWLVAQLDLGADGEDLADFLRDMAQLG